MLRNGSSHVIIKHVETTGIEPVTYRMQSDRSTN
jgi:hypothetical protein